MKTINYNGVKIQFEEAKKEYDNFLGIYNVTLLKDGKTVASLMLDENQIKNL